MNDVFANLPPGIVPLVAVTLVAGAVNAVAGGGTILTFPVLAAILPGDAGAMVTANATSTIGLWPGAIAAAWAYLEDRTGRPPWAGWLLVPSFAGAVVGTVLVLALPSAWFAAAVPWLILVAATVFAAQPRLAAWAATVARRPAAASAPASTAEQVSGVPSTARLVTACLLQFLVAVYGGYFGAGIGILMLAVLGLLGLGDIHRLNAVKNVLATTINGVSAAIFAAGSIAGAHDVSWPHAAAMSVAAVLGGCGGAFVARRLPARVVRRCVALIGFALAAYYFARG